MMTRSTSLAARMRTFRGFAVFCLCVLSIAANAQDPNSVTVEKGGCQVRVRAYTDPAYSGSQASRYTFEIVRTPPNSGSWDFTLDADPSYHYTILSGGVSPAPYGGKLPVTLTATLHQYETLDETVTFHNLTVVPMLFPVPESPVRVLLLPAPLTVTTPSGISVTLPAQKVDTLKSVLRSFGGNANALFISVQITPAEREATLPLSPLYRKYHLPVSIKLDCPKPNYMVSSQADNTYKTIAVGIPNLKTVTHLDTLTLILRQRVDVQSLPLAITLPPPGAGP